MCNVCAFSGYYKISKIYYTGDDVFYVRTGGEKINNGNFGRGDDFQI